MKVNEANIQLYRPEQIRRADINKDAKPVQMSQFVKARFADLLNDNERKFIAENFQPEPVTENKTPKLGRFIDVRA